MIRGRNHWSVANGISKASEAEILPLGGQIAVFEVAAAAFFLESGSPCVL